ncbi:carboxy-terminal region remorin [Sesbania bispinosa]|nr:carboxy-terminal region remorin [Sesbania bispinosa]
MENLIKQIRVKLTGAEEENKADLGGSWDQKIPIQNISSFKGDVVFPLQALMEHATAIAAAAFAISSQEASEIPQKKKISEPPETSLTRTRSKMDGKKSPISQLSKKLSVSFKITDDQDNKVPISPETEEKKPEKTITPAPSMKKTSTFSEKFKSTDDKKPETPPPERLQVLADFKTTKWQPRADSNKNKHRRKKSKCLGKGRAQKDKREQSEDERKRAKALRKYQDKMKYIEEIAGEQEHKQMKDEGMKSSKQKRRQIIRTTGKLPRGCSCF